MIIKANSGVIRAEFILWALFAFLMPIWQNILPLILGCILILRVVFKSQKVNPVTRTDRVYLVMFILLYAAHALGMLWTENVAHGLFDLQVKLSLVLIPLMLFTSPLDKEDLVNAGLGGLVGGSVVAAIISFIYVGWSYFGANDDILFAGTGFSFYMHQGYYASFFCLSFIVSVEFLIRRHKLFSGITLKLIWGIVLLLAAAIIFTLSRTGTIVLVLSVLLLSLKVILKWRSKKAMAILLLGLVVGGVLVSSTATRLVGRFDGLIKTLSVSDQLDITAKDANTVRILLWDITGDLISENFWIGVGTGDIKDEIKTNAESKGYTGVSNMDLNIHNQFTQVFITLGFPAFLIFMVLFLTPFIEALRRRSLLILLVTMTLGLFSLTESFIERQAGVMLFSMLFPLFVFHFRGVRSDPVK